MGIANTSMLVNIHISVWSGRKLDKQVSAEVDVAKATKTRAGNYHKNLFAGVDELAAVTRVASRIRVWHAEQTLPWSDGGERLLPMGNFLDYKKKLTELEQEFNDAVRTFCDKYSTLIAAQAFTMGALFDRNDYPYAQDIAHKFELRYTFSPVPEVGDWRVAVGEEDLQNLRSHYEKAFDERLAKTNRELWDRLHEVLTHMADRLADTPEGERKVFRDSLLETPLKLCDILTKLNVTNDPKLEQARKQLQSAIATVDIVDLRQQPSARVEVRTQVEDILKRFDF